MDRKLSGVFVRSKRNEKWESVDFTDLTEQEMNEFFDRRLENSNKEEEYMWVRNLSIILAKNIKEIGDSFDILTKSE